MKTNATKYSNFGIVFSVDGVALALDVMACDMEAAKADVMAAYPMARIIQVCCR